MCVIICCDKESGFPALATLESAEQLNQHGGGIAWIGENGKVKYRKGINAKEIFEITKQIPLPAIIHFRIASIGVINNNLCHPFPINENADCDLAGEAESVLFHNGTWSNWDQVCLEAVIKKDIKFPDGDWSDSRAMAWLVDKYGVGVLNLLSDGNKIVVFSKEGFKRFGRWTKVQDFTCSNDYFDRPAFDWDFGGFDTKKVIGSDDPITLEDDPITMSNDDDDVHDLFGSRKKPSKRELKREIKRTKKKLKKLHKHMANGTPITKLKIKDSKKVNRYSTGYLTKLNQDRVANAINAKRKLVKRNDLIHSTNWKVESHEDHNMYY